MEPVVLVPGLYVVPFPVGQAYLWRDADDTVTLIDSGPSGSAPALEAAVRTLGLDPGRALRRIVLTHSHHDHTGGAAGLIERHPGVTVLAHGADAPVVRGEVAQPQPVFDDAPGWERQLFETVHPGQSADRPAIPSPPPCRVDRDLADGDVLDFAGGAHVIAVPGHTDGSIALHLPRAAVLLTGDTVARKADATDDEPSAGVMPGVFNRERRPMLASLGRLAAREPVETLCFGHGAPLLTGGGAALREVAAAHGAYAGGR